MASKATSASVWPRPMVKVVRSAITVMHYLI
jgi:hypothetical protein